MSTPFRRKKVIKRKSRTLPLTQLSRPPSPPPQIQPPLAPSAMTTVRAQDGGISCTVCLEGFTDDRRRPLMLPACGHTFCKLCMSTLMAREGARGTFLCPTCRRAHPIKAVENLPVNYALLEVAMREVVSAAFSSATSSRQHSQQGALKPEESCAEHGSRLAFWCVSCEVAACGECLFDQHPRPDHKLLRLQDQLSALQESMRVRAVRLVSQLKSATEENTAEVRAALVFLVENLRQRRVLDDLTRRARTAREAAKTASDFGDVASIRDTIEVIQREFQEAAITTRARVCVSNPALPSPSLSSSSSTSSSSTTPIRSSKAETPRAASQGDLNFPLEMTHDRSSPAAQPQVPDMPSRPSTTSPPDSTSHPASALSPPAALASNPPPPNAPNTPSPPPDSAPPPAWPPLLCGVLSGSWTSSRVSLEPRGLHVYTLRTMKEKSDLFVNLDVMIGLMPLEAPEVFLDLHDGREALGRIYIALQVHLRRAQQFFSLCVGDRGPSYRKSAFHSVLRRSGEGEGLVGGDYEGKAGKGGAAILKSVKTVEGEEEVAKKCERGMVVRASPKVEMAAQFCIMVRDGPRNRPVVPFGRVTKGISVVEEACRRPALTVGVEECGWVLPVQL